MPDSLLVKPDIITLTSSSARAETAYLLNAKHVLHERLPKHFLGQLNYLRASPASKSCKFNSGEAGSTEIAIMSRELTRKPLSMNV